MAGQIDLATRLPTLQGRGPTVSGTEWEPAEPGQSEPQAAQPEPGQPQAAQPPAAPSEAAELGSAEAVPAEPDARQPGAGSGGAQQGEFVPGLSTPSPAMEYLLNQQRRRGGRFTAAAGGVIAIVIIAALLAVVTSHGHNRTGSKLTAAQVVASAASRAAGLRSYTATMTERLSGSTSGTISGTMMVQRSPVEIAMNLTETVSGETIPVSSVVTTSEMYLKLPSLAGIPGLPAGMASKWLKIPLLGPGGTSPLAAIEQELQRENPLTETAMFTAAQHVRAAGSQVIDGVRMTKYVASARPDSTAKSLPADVRSELAPYVRLMTGKVSLAVWIDGHGQVRKVSGTEHVGTVNVTTTFTYGAFNQPVSISIPAGSQVYSVPQSDLTD
jgi:hypothetical protein